MDHGIFKGEDLIIICGSREKAEEMLVRYPGHEVHPVEQVNKRWVKTKL